jgi:hypothetical protein
MRAEPIDDAAERAGEAVELASGHRSEERPREPLVVTPELGDERLAARGQGDQRGPPVGWVWFPCHQTVGDQGVDQPGHGARRYLQRVSENTLGYRAALPQLPQQVRARGRQPQRLDRLRHVLVQHNDELEDAIEEVFILLYYLYSEAE